MNLSDIKSEDVEDVPHCNKIIPAKIIDVHDGDTCTVIFEYGNTFFKTKIRCNGIDTPEIRPSKNNPNRELEKQAAEHIRNKVKYHVEDKILNIKLIKHDKYGGRYEGEIYLEKDVIEPFPHDVKTLADYLLYKKYGRKYEGSKKEPWSKKELKHMLLH